MLNNDPRSDELTELEVKTAMHVFPAMLFFIVVDNLKLVAE